MEKLTEQFPELFYPVRKVRSEDLVPGILTNSYNSHKVIVETPIGIKEVNSCSDIYRVIPNHDIIMPLWEEISSLYPVKLVPRVYQDAVFKYDFVIDLSIDMGKRYEKDMIFPSLSIDNSYNGRRKLGATMAIMRMVCTNGMMIPEELFPGETFMHTPTNGEGLAIEKVMAMVAHFVDKLGEFVEPFSELRAMPVHNIINKVDEVIEATKFPIGQREAVLERIEFEMQSLNLPKTDWLVYNGFNFQLNHNPDIEMPPYKKAKIDSDIQLFLLNN